MGEVTGQAGSATSEVKRPTGNRLTIFDANDSPLLDDTDMMTPPEIEPADQLYAYRAGPDGVEVLEFRHATSFDMQIADKKPERWVSIMDAAAENKEAWTAMRPN